MVKCSVVGCKNYENNKYGPKKKFFLFPKNKNLCALWAELSGGGSQVNTNGTKICSDHFVEDDYRLQDILLNTEFGKRMLKKGAVPSQLLPVTIEEREIDESERKEIVREAIDEYDRYSPNRQTRDVAVQTEVRSEYGLEQSYRKEIAALKKELQLERNLKLALYRSRPAKRRRGPVDANSFE
ncbi:uncharacterized protein LOC128733733 isoform X2 [Sabethes cyaneus]|uniref:uncharacterized protein LOC128733733 isoform X2 n=1 Tax=Sabethes cyaneus TaxID=53552 RepID=UPI00237DBB47|nr:uncharacterized protein LOC128733733 isoform X2 [Sabethes cyaneus]